VCGIFSEVKNGTGSLLTEASLESFKTRCPNTEMMKNLANVDTSDKLIPLQRPSRNCNTLAFSIPSCRTSIRKESFYPRTTKDWNALKDASVGAPSLEAFKACLILTVSCPIFPFILIAKYLFTGSLKNRSIDNLETQKKYISMKNSQFLL
jgi:hypothetical protein